MMFQSHLGSISTGGPDRGDSPSSRFNPTLVRLARARRALAALIHDGFNPTLVRLALFQAAL